MAELAVDALASMRTLLAQPLDTDGAGETIIVPGTETPAGTETETTAVRPVELTPRELARVVYIQARRNLATAVADRLAVPVDLDAVWASTDSVRLTAVFSALAQVGTPYRRKGTAPGGFDCSGLTGFAWAQAGVELPRNSASQIRSVQTRTTTDLRPGDLVYRPGHVMMYLGASNLIVESPQRGRPVRVNDWGRIRKLGSPVVYGAEGLLPTPTTDGSVVQAAGVSGP